MNSKKGNASPPRQDSLPSETPSCLRKLGLDVDKARNGARFIEAYEAILGMERKEAGRLPEVATYLEEHRAVLETGEPAEWND